MINKYGLFLNTNQIPVLDSSLIFFDVKNIKDLNDMRALNYNYLIRFFFGKHASFLYITSKFHLGITFFNYRIFAFFPMIFAFFCVGLFVNDLLGCTSRDYFSYKVFSSSGRYFLFIFKDMNVFLERKNNLGFYFLKDFLNLSLILKGSDFVSNYLLLQSFKFFKY